RVEARGGRARAGMREGGDRRPPSRLARVRPGWRARQHEGRDHRPRAGGAAARPAAGVATGGRGGDEPRRGGGGSGVQPRQPVPGGHRAAARPGAALVGLAVPRRLPHPRARVLDLGDDALRGAHARGAGGGRRLSGFGRAILVTLEEGRIVDTIVQGLFTPVAHLPLALAAVAMMVVHAVVHIPVPSPSGHAVLTLPVLVPLADLLGLSRQVTVLAYPSGGGLCELLT